MEDTLEIVYEIGEEVIVDPQVEVTEVQNAG